jgi:pimeloyl-ACP methyl ester carboxylesterase
MLHQRVNGYDMAYIAVGSGPPLVCVHGSLCDFRVWSCVLGPLSCRHRVIAPSLRHFFPEHWDGTGADYTMEQHVADTIGFIEALNTGPVHLMGHSRGGHIAFRVAQQRPDLLRRVVLAEPGGDLDASLAPAQALPPMRGPAVAAAERIAAGDIDGGLAGFIDALEGQGTWRALPGYEKQELRDNARTLLGQINEQRQPFTRADAEAIRVPTLFVGGEKTPGSLPVVLRALSAHVPGAQVAIIPNTAHFMFGQDPVRFCDTVLGFLAAAG